MKRILVFCALSIPVAASQQAPRPPLPPAASIQVDYDRDVRPLLSQNCYACHGEAIQQAGLRLDLRQNALRGGDYGPVIVPGRSAESKLIRRLVDGDGGLQMPPTGALTPNEIGILRAWIDQGAEFRNDVVERPARPVDPRLAAVITAVRTQPASVVEGLLTANPELATAADAGGSTPLHHAAGFGSVQTMTVLLDRGADVNAKNRRGSTPLHWAIHDLGKVRLLVTRGAALDAKQAEGRTPLYLASMTGGGRDTVEFLLQRGADATIPSAVGQTPLMVASARGDVAVMQQLVAARADVNGRNGAGETPLMFAATSGNADAVRFLISRGADARARSKRNETALGNAGTSGVEEIMRILLDAGAEVDVQNIRGYSPLMLAASSDAMPATAVRLLLARGANQAFTGDYNETARDLAAKRGDTEVARLLGARPAAPAPAMAVAHAAEPSRSIPQAVEKALALMQKQSYTFIRTGGCNSCHSQDLPSVALAMAKARGLRTPADIPQLPLPVDASADRLMDFVAVSAPSTAWELLDFGMNEAQPNAFTDAAVRYIKAMQTPEGNWSSNESRRPPMNAGDYQAAALSIYALKRFSRGIDRPSSEEAVSRAVMWLEKAQPQFTQDRAFQAIALAWAKEGSSSARQAALALAPMQRADGGWSQLPGLPSDAYATGQALYALSIAGQVPVTDPVFRRGVNYLLQTQAEDGSWHVKSRSIWFQPYFESGFPYGQDQFISTAGTAWAAIALTTAAPPAQTSRR